MSDQPEDQTSGSANFIQSAEESPDDKSGGAVRFSKTIEILESGEFTVSCETTDQLEYTESIEFTENVVEPSYSVGSGEFQVATIGPKPEGCDKSGESTRVETITEFEQSAEFDVVCGEEITEEELDNFSMSAKRSLSSLSITPSDKETSWTKHPSKADSWSQSSFLKGDKLNSCLIPFQLQWAFGVGSDTPVLNITTRGRNQIYYSATHASVIFDYNSREMKLCQGHKNLVSCIAADNSGRWLISADRGEDNTVIVWDNVEGLPVNTIFNPHPDCGTALVGISGNAKYLATVGFESKPVFKFWLWTFGNDTPNDSLMLSSGYKGAVGIRFNPNVQEHMMVAFQKQIVFLQWDSFDNKLLPPIIAAVKNMKKYGLITDCTYIDKCHECVASTNEGYVLVFGSSVYTMPFEEGSIQNDKVFAKAVKITQVAINCIESVDGVVATGDEKGNLRFYDKRLRILYWCQSFSLPSITSISFNLEPRLYKMKDALDFDDVSDNIADPCDLENCMCEDRSEEYEYLYAQLVPSDATIEKLPFIVRDFIVATEDGRVAQVDYMHNQCNFFFRKADAPVTAIETHTEKPYLVIGYANGAISLHNYKTHDLIIEQTLVINTAETGEGANAITYIKYSSECLHLACGMGSGKIFFLDTILLTPKTTPYQFTKAKVIKLAFSLDNIYFAYYDENSTVVLMRYCTKATKWVCLGKLRSHYKPINDILFSTYLPSRFFSIGNDRYLVEYDLVKSNEGNLETLSRERIEQRAIPICFIYNPPNGSEKSDYFFVADNQFKYKLVHDVTYMCRSVRLGPAYGCYKDSSVRKMDFIPKHDYRYLVFSNNRHMGIQKFPVDGNPYKYIGTTGHPTRITDFRLCRDGKFLFTFGDDDPCVLMWSINVTSVEILEKKGGVELEPYYCLMEGGIRGWLFREMQDLFYYMQILHQGENTVLPRIVTDQIPVAELPDLMRACGFYPSEYEIENMIIDARYRDYEQTKVLNEYVSFLDFVKMYINHRPAHGIHLDTLRNRFETFCLAGEGSTSSSINGQSFVSTICERGEIFSVNKAFTCLATLMHAIDDNGNEVNQNFAFLPEEITFENFLEEILGMDMERQTTDDENPIYLEEEDEVC